MAIVPSGSLDPEASKLTVWLVSAGFGVAVKDAVGGRSSIVRFSDAEVVAPSLSVTRTLTIRARALG